MVKKMRKKNTSEGDQTTYYYHQLPSRRKSLYLIMAIHEELRAHMVAERPRGKKLLQYKFEL